MPVLCDSFNRLAQCALRALAALSQPRAAQLGLMIGAHSKTASSGFSQMAVDQVDRAAGGALGNMRP